MDVSSSSDARREVEIANRILRDREADHARELENVKQAQRDQVDSLSTNQATSMKRVREQTNEELTGARDRFDKAIRQNTDSYEKSLNEQRTDSYDKYGRLANENARDRAKAQELKTQQIQTIIDGHETQQAANSDERNKTISRLQDKFNEDRTTLQKNYEQKAMGSQDSVTESIKKQTAASRANSDELVKRANADADRIRTGSDAKFHKLADDSATERDRMMTNFSSREKQLNDDRAFNEKNLMQAGQKSFEEYRERSAGALNDTINENNQMNSQNRRNTEGKLSKANQMAELEKQQLRNESRSRESDLVTQNAIERDRNALQSTLAERRHRQENFMTAGAQAENSSLQSDDMKAHYSENLRDMDDKFRKQFENHQSASANKMYLQDADANAERMRIQHDKDSALGKSFTERTREKNALIREYETRQNQLDDLHGRQAADSKNYMTGEIRAVREKTNKDIQMNNRDNTTRLYEAQQNLRNRSEEFEMQRRMELGDANTRYTDKSKRVQENYNRNLMGNKDAYDEETSEFKHESQLQLATQRGDAEHDKRMTLMDLLMKNRTQLAAYETKMNQTKDDHDSELAKMRSDNEKGMRETIRRARETLDTERVIHTRELEAKDIGTKEKLRMQEEAFKDTIEKMRRSHELSLKKS